MVLKPDQERVKTLLKDTITLLCRNGLEFKQNFAVDAVIGVTLDEDEVFLVSINEIVKSESYKAPDSQEHQHEDSAKTSGIPRKRRKHHRVKQAKDVSSVDVSTDGEESETFSAFAEGAQQNESLSKKEPQSDEEESDDLVMIKEELDNWDNSAHDNTSNSPGNLQPFFGDLAEAGSSHSQNFDMSQAQSSGNTGAWPFPGDLSYGSDPSIASPGQFPLRGREPSALGADTSQGQGPQQTVDGRESGSFPSTAAPSATSHSRTTVLARSLGENIDQLGRTEEDEHSMNHHFGDPDYKPAITIKTEVEKIQIVETSYVSENSQLLRKNPEVHHGIFKKQRYTCELCGKIFVDKEKFDGHLNIHADEKPYLCATCEATFAYKSSLKRHMVECPGNKGPSFVCNLCGSQFSSWRLLRQHQIGKHEKRAHACVCGKVFNWSQSLSRHVKSCATVKANDTTQPDEDG